MEEYNSKAEFITAVLAEDTVIEQVGTDTTVETKGDYKKGYLEFIVIEPTGGKNIRQVWYLENTNTGVTSYQTANTINPSKNNFEKKLQALTDYLDSNFDAYFLVRDNLDKNWAEVDVLKLTDGKLVSSKVLVFKKGTSAVNHLEIV